MPRPLIIGITGGIGSGKSHARKFLAALGCGAVDADTVAHDVYKPGMPAFRDVVRRFGDSVVARDGTIHRPSLGKVVFSDPGARADLEAIVWPHVADMLSARIEQLGQELGAGCELLLPSGDDAGLDDVAAALRACDSVGMDDPAAARPCLGAAGLVPVVQGRPVVALEAALLVAAGWDSMADAVWYTFVDRQRALGRIMDRDGLPEADASRRLAAQQSVSAALKRADVIIDTSGSLARTRAQLAIELCSLVSRA